MMLDSTIYISKVPVFNNARRARVTKQSAEIPSRFDQAFVAPLATRIFR